MSPRRCNPWWEPGTSSLISFFPLLQWSELQVSHHSRLRNAFQDINYAAAGGRSTWKQQGVELKIESVVIGFCSLDKMNHVRLICSYFFLNVTLWFRSQRISGFTGLVAFYPCHCTRGFLTYERNSSRSSLKWSQWKPRNVFTEAESERHVLHFYWYLPSFLWALFTALVTTLLLLS